jgi:hypothetical protein
MQKPVGQTLSSLTSLWILCACCALWGAPAAAQAASEHITPTPALSTSAATAPTSTARGGGVWFDRRVLTLLAIGCLVGILAGWASRDPRETHFRLLNRPRKTGLPVLVPPGPAPRLIPSDSPNSTRARWTRAPVSCQTRASATRSGVIDYIAAFADSAEASDGDRVDYLLVSSDSLAESLDPPGGFDGSLRPAGKKAL